MPNVSGIGPAGEVLQADERDAASAHHELPRVGTAHTHHQVAIGRTVDLEHVLRARHRLLGEPYDVDVQRERAQIVVVGAERRVTISSACGPSGSST